MTMKPTLNEVFSEPLTANQIRSVQVALKETRGLLTKELRYAPDLQNGAYMSYLLKHEQNLVDLLAKNNVSA
jgi:hypothetical protein